MTYIVLMGAPGAGKGTQAKLLEKNLGLPQVATGDLFRHNLKNKTELGLLAQSYMDRGELVPDSVTVDMVRARLSQPDCANGVVLDGFPRNTSQADALNDLLAEMGERINVVPHIHVNQEVLVDRLLKRAEIEGRADDNEETIRTRMKVYQEQTSPLLDYYRERNLLVEVNGEQSINEVQQSLLLVIQAAATGEDS
jgi:adenylate kinase